MRLRGRAVDSEKMSKSLGNFFTIRDVLRRYHALALRWFLVATHYPRRRQLQPARPGGGALSPWARLQALLV